MIGRKSILSFANMAIGMVLGLVSAKLIALYMQTGPLGQLTAAMGFLGVLFFVTDLGMGAAHIKRVSEGRDPGDCFATFAVFKLVSTLVFVVVAVGGFLAYTMILGRTIETTSVPVLAAILVYFVAKSLQEVGQSSFDARLETARSQLTLLTDTIVRVGLTLLAVFAFAAVVFTAGPLAGTVTAETPFLGWIAEDPGLALALATAAGGVAAATASLVMLFGVLERGRFRWALLKDYAGFALPLFLTSATGMIAGSIDSAVLGFFLDEDQTGIFGGIRRLVNVLAGIGVPVGLLLFATMSGQAARRDMTALHSTMNRSIRYLSLVIVPIAAFTAAFAAPIIRLVLAEPFVPGAAALGILAAYVVLTTLASPHANLLLGVDKPGVLARIGVSTSLTLIVLNLLLVPDDIRSLGIDLPGLGVLGTAIATLVSGIVYYVTCRVATRRHAGYRERAHVIWHVGGALAMVGTLYALHVFALPLERWFDLLLYVPLGAVVYGLFLVAVRELTWEDWRYVRDAVHPGEMARYVAGELRTRRR